MVERPGSDKHLPVINKPFITDALGLERVGDELAQVRVACLPQDQRTLDGAKHVTLLSSPVGGEGGASRDRGDGFRLMLPLSPRRGFRKVRAECLTDTRPLGVAEHADKIQVGCHQRLERAVGHMAPDGPGAPLPRAQDRGTLGVGRAQELSHLELAIFLALPAQQNRADNAA